MATVRRYELGDFIALLAGVVSVAMAIWGLPILADDASAVDPIGSAWGFYAGAGVLAVLSVFIAQRARAAARGLLVFAGVLLLVGLLLLWPIGWTTRITTLVLGLAMIGASAGIGRVRR